MIHMPPVSVLPAICELIYCMRQVQDSIEELVHILLTTVHDVSEDQSRNSLPLPTVNVPDVISSLPCPLQQTGLQPLLAASLWCCLS